MSAPTRVNGRVTFVNTLGNGSLNQCSQRLAAHLPVPKLETDAVERTEELFGGRVLSRGTLAALPADLAFVRRLRRVPGALHFPSQHLGRYARFLPQPYAITVHDAMRWLDRNRDDPLIEPPTRLDRINLGLDLEGARRAAAVITVSETSKRDLVRLGIPGERVTVVHNGIDHEHFRPVERRPLDDPYVLFVGTEQPRKNLATLLRAFRMLKDGGRFPRLRLVKAGSAGLHPERQRNETMKVVRELGLEDDVHFVAECPSDELPAWYSHAACFALPSLYEGFGLPPLEAMACGCPVVVSAAGALPEVVGDAALVVDDPRDHLALARALERVLGGGGFVEELVARGRERAARFTWERAAEQTLEVYGCLLASGA